MQIRAFLHYGKNRAKLVRFKEQKNILLFKNTNLTGFSPLKAVLHYGGYCS